MDEPMEESTEGVQSVVDDGRKNKLPSMMRPNSMVTMPLTPQDYETVFWPTLEHAIDQLLELKHGQYLPISYEKMYSCVYKCVCKQFSERLYRDLIQHISCHLESKSQTIQSPDSRKYIENFHEVLSRYLTALDGIVPIFNYLNRFYVEAKLATCIQAELKKLFVMHIIERHVTYILPLMVEFSSKPFSIQPHIMATLAKNLHDLSPDISKLRPQLFAKYLPNILPPTSVNELDRYIAEAKQLQRDLRTHPEFISGDQGRKRPPDDDFNKPPSLSIEPAAAKEQA